MTPTDLAESNIRDVAELDPALLATPATRALVDLGSAFIVEVTERYGTPAAPLWASGTSEIGVFMAYHCGGRDGHTSVGPLGAGVPRAVLQIAAAINTAAGREVLDPPTRASLFVAAAAHDHTQLCGRALLPEGQGHGHGDERLSAGTARARCLALGVHHEVAALVYASVMATAFDPMTGRQNVDYDHTARVILAQEITAAADLLSLTAPRGPLSSLEMVCESLCMAQRGRLVHARLPLATSIDSVPWLLDCVDRDPELTAAFAQGIAGQIAFYSGHRYSDTQIRAVCGAGIDELFPGRAANVETLKHFAGLLERHGARQLWTVAGDLARAL